MAAVAVVLPIIGTKLDKSKPGATLDQKPNLSPQWKRQKNCLGKLLIEVPWNLYFSLSVSRAAVSSFKKVRVGQQLSSVASCRLRRRLQEASTSSSCLGGREKVVSSWEMREKNKV